MILSLNSVGSIAWECLEDKEIEFVVIHRLLEWGAAGNDQGRVYSNDAWCNKWCEEIPKMKNLRLFLDLVLTVES